MLIEPGRIADIRQREDARFIRERPRSTELLCRAGKTMSAGVPMSWMVSLYSHVPTFVREARGAYITDVDGHRYLDMNLADTSMACGYANETVAEAVSKQFRKGSQLLLPTEEAIIVTEHLSDRFDMPFWQFTLSASNANQEAIRISRAFTNRDRVLLFDGKYHGMLDETCHVPGETGPQPEVGGFAKDAGRNTDIVAYNDLNAAEAVLSREMTACVLVEAAVTNTGGVIMPEPGFLEGLRSLTHRHGTVLVLDEAHTHVCVYGGLKRAWSVACDVLVLGKAIAGGIPAGLYGLGAELADFVGQTVTGGSRGYVPGLAIGGTLYGNPLQFAAIRATLDSVLTVETQTKAADLGERLATGIEGAAEKHSLPWSTHRLFSRSGYHFAPELPRNNAEALAAADHDLRDLMRVYMANRGIWEAIYSASPAVSIAAEAADVDFYISVYHSLLDELAA